MICLVLPQMVISADLVGTRLPVSLDIRQGNANYRIPIEVYPGTAGLQPGLSLLYNSQGANGLLGAGWTMGGLFQISRCAKSIITDGVNYDDEDRYCLNGQRLIVVNGGVYGVNGTEYRTEIDSYSKIISTNTRGSGPAYFEVWTKDGLYKRYGYEGNGATSKLIISGIQSVHTYALSLVEDQYRNSIYYTYHAIGEEFYIEKIQYGRPNTNDQREVNFSYEARTDIIGEIKNC